MTFARPFIFGFGTFGRRRSASGGIIYLLRDDFTTDRAAGAVNGTSAEPGPGTRTAIDTESKLSISGGKSQFAGGKASPAYGDPGLWYEGQARTVGKLLVAEFFATTLSGRILAAGWDINQSGDLGGYGIIANSVASIIAVDNGAQITIASGLSASTIYYLLIALNSTGAQILIQGGAYTYPTLLYIANSGAGATLYPSLNNYNAVYSAEFISAQPTAWLARPLVSDSFATAFGTTDGLGHTDAVSAVGSGGSGITWTHNTYGIVSAKAINTPGVGSEVVVNGDFETGSPPTGWSASSATLSASADVHGGAQALRVIATASVGNANRSMAVTAYAWYRITGWVKRLIGNGQILVQENGGAFATLFNTGSQPPAAYTQYGGTFRTPVTASVLVKLYGIASADDVLYDDLSLKRLTLADLFASVSVSTADVIAEVNIVLGTRVQAGLVLNLDSTSSPANFSKIYIDASTCYLVKCVAGVYTQVFATAYTYSAGAKLRVLKLGTEYRVVYNGTLINTGTIADAGIISNTKHGLFSTDSTNTLDNFAVWATGVGGEYIEADSFFLTNSLKGLFAIGDSKTNGYTWPLLTIDYLNLLAPGHWSEVTPRYGISGYTVPQMKTYIDANLASVTGTANIVCLNLGANDVAQGYTEAPWKADLTSIINSLRAKWPGVQIYIARAWRRGFLTECNMIATWIGDIVALYPSGVYLGPDERIWLENGDDGATLATDGTHYSTAGNVANAAQWKTAIGL